jgi:hypothetical protein
MVKRYVATPVDLSRGGHNAFVYGVSVPLTTGKYASMEDVVQYGDHFNAWQHRPNGEIGVQDYVQIKVIDPAKEQAKAQFIDCNLDTLTPDPATYIVTFPSAIECGVKDTAILNRGRSFEHLTWQELQTPRYTPKTWNQKLKEKKRQEAVNLHKNLIDTLNIPPVY